MIYQDPWQGGADKGVYGVKVVLLFTNSGFEGDPITVNSLVHPVTGTCVNQTHYADVDVDGHFSFDFSVSGSTWNAAFHRAILFVTTSNGAISLISSSDNDKSVINTIKITGGSCGDWSVFAEDYEDMNTPASNFFTKSDIKITLLPFVGSALRNTQFSQDFYKDRPVSANVPTQIPTLIWDIEDDPFWLGNYGFFNGGSHPSIEFNSKTVNSARYFDHEWGHYSSYWLWSGFPSGGNYNFVEGWANFFAFAVRNYASAQYGEDAIYWDKNMEERPFYIPRFGEWIEKSVPKNAEYNEGVDTPFPDVPYIVTASFLWNLYDKYSDPGFKAPIYNNADNEDVSEQSLFFSTTPRAPISPQTTMEQQFLVDLKNQVGTDEAASMQKIYDFCYGPSHDGLSPTVNMRPAQLKNLSGDGYLSAGPFHTFLSWSSQEYTTTWNGANPIPYKNPRDGFHIYQSDGSSGWYDIYPCCVQYGSVGSTGASFDPDVTGHYDFLVSTYNADGDAWNGQTVTPSYSDKIQVEKPGVDVLFGFTDVSSSPNPFKDYFAINLKAKNKGTVNYEVLTPLGVTVLSGTTGFETAGDKEIRIDGSRLSSGAYIVKLFVSGEQKNTNYQYIKVYKE